MSVELDLVGIAVKDMGKSLEFYRLLELPIPEGQDAEPHVEADLGRIRIAWDTTEVLEQVYGSWVSEPIGHRIELAFKCDRREEVDAVYDRVVGQGYRGHKEPWDAFWGQRYAVVEDPDGNLVSLFA
jgi:catechol 2,3-dioxygenase-like lactoylglutathione lyase family enzyme